MQSPSQDEWCGLFQSQVCSLSLPKVLESAENVVLSAPTGSGKTVIFELALIRMLTKDPENARAVYLAPTKALCSERTRDWSTRFGSVGCGVTELTGDSVHGLQVARKSRLIVTTPEKWDSLTRRWDEHSGILSSIRLLLIDEVHILNEVQRGARIEVVVTRTQTWGNRVRFVAVSATVPNLEDVATWIGPNPNVQRPGTLPPSAEIFQFDDTYRPCPLQKHVYGYPKAKDEFAFQAYLNHKLAELIEIHAAGRPCLIFCATRRSTLQAANTIAEARRKAEENGGAVPPASNEVRGRSSLQGVTFDDQDLQRLATSGIAFHHAGLSIFDRRSVEQAFLADKIGVLCCTTTLATGINLPAYCVVIRGTKQFDGQWCEMSELDLIQMMGRAGRPQFDRSGIAVIMCEDTMQAHYRELVSGTRAIESSLAPCLVEHVNAEIGLRGRMTEQQIEDWIRKSFMWTRLHKNPTYYLSQEEGIGLDSVEEILKHLVTRTLTTLKDADLILRSETAFEVTSTEYGIIMSRFFIRHKTMLALIAIAPGANTRAVLEAVSRAEEFGDQRIRPGEKGFLNLLRTHPEIRYPPRQVAQVADKISLLVQAQLSAINLAQLSQPAVGEASPHMDIRRIIPHATRIARAVVDITIYRQDGTACKVALDLARSIAAEAWDGSPAMLRQIDQIGERSIKALANAGITTWQSLASTTSAKIEMILNRNPPFGSKVIAAAQSVPRIELEMMQRSSSPSTSSFASLPANRSADPSAAVQVRPSGIKVVLDVVIRIENRATCMLKSKKSKMALSVCILTLTSDGDYVDFRRMPIWRFQSEKQFTLHVHLTDPRRRILTYAACDEIAGTLMQANLLPVDMSMGSHRTRIARAELQRGGMSDEAVVGSKNLAGLSQSSVNEGCVEGPEDTAFRDMLNVGEEEGTRKRCKHKCKGDCRHVCCQRAREQELFGKQREYQFQSRAFDDGSQSTMQRYLKPVGTPFGEPSVLSHKRKAILDRFIDAEAPQNLLSRLDRQESEYDRAFDTADALQMPDRHRGGAPSAAQGSSASAMAIGSWQQGRSTAERLVRARSGLRSEAVPRMPPLGGVAYDNRSHTSRQVPAEAFEVHGGKPTPSAERPAQRHFLRAIGPPQWLNNDDAAS
ncbi:hypothetical protein EX895_005497 [Sporisorium graminicola]|uniref:DNA 3'-5' helicase n=1 Tax=Sporisorium graminicola TaxID=280036 RepID=A0A4U7KLY7_9BASI|nr:hypothetical protein EX895_005497 [Sporisorium graminicola]TKY85335.1 hypothetical protein EX895_005497 [Sporisorium graminicola]